ncbi:MAG: hypothetical protein DRO40_04420 [Thermoprotei archaeon]|nr:MAG: hypothetical protein DRO40_04420 [Thermoprotei archaeon]
MPNVDFLRHIANPKLAEYSKARKQLTGVLDEVKKLIARAEDKYNFSIFGGDPRNLAKYLKSNDFDLVVNTLKSANALDVLEDILRTVIEKYRDLPEVVEAANQKIKDLRQGKVEINEIKALSEALSRELKDAKIQPEKDHVKIEYDGLKATIKPTEEGYNVSIKIEIERVLDNRIDIINLLSKIYSVLTGK